MFRRTLLFTFLPLLGYLAVPACFAEEASDRPRIAIREPKVGPSVAKTFHPDELLGDLEAALNATRKFELLTRDKSKLVAVREEEQFASSELSAGNAAETGKLEAANYLVIPTVTHYSLGRSARPVPNIDDKYFVKDSGGLTVSVQVLDSTTGAVKGTYTLDSSVGTREEIANSRGGAPPATLQTRLYKQAADQFASKLIDAVFPTRVVRVEAGDVWINRGAESGIAVGSKFTVFRPGAELVDPDTHESLGNTETAVGDVKIVRVNPKVSVAQAEGKNKNGEVREGDILRRK